MKQPLLAVLLLGLAFISGYEIKESTQPVPVGNVPTYQKIKQPQAAGTQASLEGSDRKRSHEHKVLELTKKIKENATVLNELDQRLKGEAQSQDPEASTDAPEIQLAQMQAQLQYLKDQKRVQIQLLQQRAALEQAQEQGKRVAQEQASHQLQEQLQQEKAVATALNRQVQELSSINDQLTPLDVLRPQAQAKQDQVRQLQAKLQEFQIGVAQQNTLDQALRQQRQESDYQEIQERFDAQIQQQQQRLAEYQKESRTLQHQQAAGQAADESLSEKYRSLQNEQSELLHQLEVEKNTPKAVATRQEP